MRACTEESVGGLAARVPYLLVKQEVLHPKRSCKSTRARKNTNRRCSGSHTLHRWLQSLPTNVSIMWVSRPPEGGSRHVPNPLDRGVMEVLTLRGAMVRKGTAFYG